MIDFSNLTFEKFSALAQMEDLTDLEKLGFGKDYPRADEPIFKDILSKLPALSSRRELKVLDIGAGCGGLPKLFAGLCQAQGHSLYLMDSEEVLSLLPDFKNTTKFAGKFPDDFEALKNCLQGQVDIIISYSVFHCGIFNHCNPFSFIDRLISLLKDQGQAIIGDIPNISKRKRFFASETGKAFHKDFMQTSIDPKVTFNKPELDAIDDSVLAALVSRCQASGCDAYIVPQAENLFFANRRDDLLIRKP